LEEQVKRQKAWQEETQAAQKDVMGGVGMTRKFLSTLLLFSLPFLPACTLFTSSETETESDMFITLEGVVAGDPVTLTGSISGTATSVTKGETNVPPPEPSAIAEFATTMLSGGVLGGGPAGDVGAALAALLLGNARRNRANGKPLGNPLRIKKKKEA
jgi:hypothetical protein